MNPGVECELQCPACADPSVLRVQAVSASDPPDDTAAILAGLQLHGCARCQGLWITGQVFDELVCTAASAAPVSPRAVRRASLAMTGPVVYRACPVCQALMHRRNFARMSGIVLDHCVAHGWFFDAEELAQLRAFVASGGLQWVEQREAERRKRTGSRHVSCEDPADDHEPSDLQAGYELGRFLLRLVRNALRWV